MDAEEDEEMQSIPSPRRGETLDRGNQGQEMANRIEEIVKAMMKPVMSIGHSFDRDDAGLLEEYLTIRGVRLMEEGGPVPNYAEIGLLVQCYACNYSRKVEHLLILVYNFRSELSGLDCPGSSSPYPDSEATPRRRRRTRGSSGGGSGEFAPIVLAPVAASVRRAPPPSAPPPSLPGQHSELRPRDPRPDRALYAHFAEEPIGSLDDFYVSRRTQRGHLVDELEADDDEEEEEEEVDRGAHQLSLLELQAAIEQRAACTPPPAATPPPASSPPPASPSSPPRELLPLCTSTPLPTPRARRRNRTISFEEHVTFEVNVDGMRNMPAREYELPRLWVRRVVHARRETILSRRRSLALSSAAPEFRGFNTSWEDNGGFRGWSRAEAARARELARRVAALLLSDCDDDDGFFERSSDSFSPNLPDRDTRLAVCGWTEALSWQEEVAQRAALAGPLRLDVLARDVRRALPPPPCAPVPWRALLRSVRRLQAQPSHVLLDVLCKAARGELEVLPGEPGLVGDFSVRLRDRTPGPHPATAPASAPET